MWKRNWLYFAAFLIVVPALALAAESVTEVPEFQTLVTGLTPVLMALAVSGFKRIVPMVPRWVVPLLAPVVAPMLVGFGDVVTGLNLGDPLWLAQQGVIAGGLREMGNWLLRASKGDTESVQDAQFRKSNSVG